MAASSDNNQDRALEEALKKFVDVYLQGEKPDIDEFVEQYPKLEDVLKQRIQDLLKIDTLFSTLVQVNEGDFEDVGAGHDLVGQTFCGFEIVEVIGRGGMGIVYLARDTKLKRAVAIKSLPAQIATDSTSQMRFRREAELLASLNHPNIAVIHDIIEQNEGPDYLILEYVPGETLAERIAREPLKLQEALSIGQQIAQAVSTAHEKGIIHRDLKPGNIKITPDGRVKVLDFGLAKALLSEVKSVETTITQPGRVMGTPAYMSPEQARGKDTDQRTDTWSLGCIMYEMLTDHLPFEGETATDTLARIIEREPDWKLLPNRIPKEIEIMLRSCLEKDPDRRLRDICDIAVTLENAVNELKYSMQQTKTIESAMTPIKSIVVLPFENLSGDSEQEYFVNGITDALSAELGKIKALRVISRTSSMRYKGTDKNVPEIAKELSVDAVIEGSVLRAGNDVRITAQLIDGKFDTHLWSENYTGTLTNILALQSEVTLAIAREIEIAITPEEEKRITQKAQVKPEAYEAYLKGIFFMEKHTEEGYKSAAKHFYRAIEIEPDYAQAHAWLGGAYWVPSIWGYTPPYESFSKGKIAMNTAYAIDETCAEALGGIGWIALYYDWDWKKAKESLEKSIELNPNYSYGYHGLAWYWVVAGRFENAIETMKTAMKLDPLSHVFNCSLATMYWYSGQYDKASEQRKKSLELAPDFVTALIYQAEQYLSMSMHQEAVESIQKAIDIVGRTSRLVVLLGRAYAISGMTRKTEILLRELQEKDRNEYVPPIHFAEFYANLGDIDEAFEWLNKAYEERYPMMPFIRVDSSFKPLHSDPRFDRLLQAMNYPE
jgi:serine/threonine protein kinase/tetratricopeptide (TPR) repeat protein